MSCLECHPLISCVLWKKKKPVCPINTLLSIHDIFHFFSFIVTKSCVGVKLLYLFHFAVCQQLLLDVTHRIS